MLEFVPAVVVRDPKTRPSHSRRTFERLVRVGPNALLYIFVDGERHEVHVRAFRDQEHAAADEVAAERKQRRVTILDSDEPPTPDHFWTSSRVEMTNHSFILAQHAWEGGVTALEVVSDDRHPGSGIHLFIGTSSGCVLWCDAIGGSVMCVAAPAVDVTARNFNPVEPLAFSSCGVVQFLVNTLAVTSSSIKGNQEARGQSRSVISVYVIFSNGVAIEIASDCVLEVSLLMRSGERREERHAARATLLDWDHLASAAPFPVAGVASQLVTSGVSTRFLLHAGTQSAIFDCSLCGRVATEVLDVFDGSLDSEKSVLVAGSSPAFSSFAMRRESGGQLSAVQVVGEVASRITGAAMGLVKGLWRGSSSAAAVPAKPLVKPLIVNQLHPRVSIFSSDVTFSSIAVDPSLVYAACYASSGRIYIIDLVAGAVWKIFKGCRNASFQWIVGANDAKKVLCLAILLPLRKVLEVHGLRDRCRLAAITLRGTSKIVPRHPFADPASLYLSMDDGSITRWSLVTQKQSANAAALASTGVTQLHHADGRKELAVDMPLADFIEDFEDLLKTSCMTAEQVYDLVMTVPLATSGGLMLERSKLHAVHDSAAVFIRRVFAPSATDPAILPTMTSYPKTAAQALNFIQLRGVLLETLWELVDARSGISTSRKGSSSGSFSSAATEGSTQQLTSPPTRLTSNLVMRLRKSASALCSGASTILDPTAAAQLRRIISDLSTAAESPKEVDDSKHISGEDFSLVASFFWSGGYKNRFRAELVHSDDRHVMVLGRLLFSRDGVEGLSAISRHLTALGMTPAQGAQLAIHWACLVGPLTGLAVGKDGEAFHSVVCLLGAQELRDVLLRLKFHLLHHQTCINRLSAAVAILTTRLDEPSALTLVHRQELTQLLARFLHLIHFVSETKELPLRSLQAGGSPPSADDDDSAPIIMLGSISPYGEESLTAFLFQRVWPVALDWPQTTTPSIAPSSSSMLHAVLGLAEIMVHLECHEGTCSGLPSFTPEQLARITSVKELVFDELDRAAAQRSPTSPEFDFAAILFCGVVTAASCRFRLPILRGVQDVVASADLDLEAAVAKHLNVSAAGRSRNVARHLQNCRELCNLEIESVSRILLTPRSSQLITGIQLPVASDSLGRFEKMDQDQHLFPYSSLRLKYAASHLTSLLHREGELLSGSDLMEVLFDRRMMLDLVHWILSRPPGIRVPWGSLFSGSVFAPLPVASTSRIGDAAVSDDYVVRRENFVRSFCSRNPPPSREDAEGLRVLVGVGTSDLVSLEFLEKAVLDCNMSEVQARVATISNRVALAQVALRLLHDMCRTILKEVLAASSSSSRLLSSGDGNDKAVRTARIQAASKAQRVEGALTGPVLAWVRGKSALPRTSHIDPSSSSGRESSSNRLLVANVKAALQDGHEGPRLKLTLDTAHFLASVCAAEGTSLGDVVISEVALELPSVIRSLTKILMLP